MRILLSLVALSEVFSHDANETHAILSTSWEDSPLAEGRKKNKNQNQNVDPANQVDQLDTRFFGDETEPRGSHRCGNVHIPPITCPSGKCPQGYPRYKRPCNGPPLKGKFKCKVMCGVGFRVADGTPKKMKCLGKQGTPGQWKVRPKTFGHVIECVRRDSYKNKN